MHVVLVTNEVWPLVEGGGIARYVADAARMLAGAGRRVTVLTSSRLRDKHAELTAAGHEGVAVDGVEWAWVHEPDGDLTPLWSHQHAWSLACWEAVRELAERERVDVVEFEDYGGAAAATVDARRTGHPALAETVVAVRLHTTWELTQALDDRPLVSIAARTVMALERHSLAFADAILAPGERALAAYRERYEELAPAVIAPMPLALRITEPGDAPPGDRPLRLFYMGRLERRKGVEELVRAVLAQSAGTVELTLAGGDTETGPGGGSMRAHLEGLGGEGVTYLGAVPHLELPALIRAHDLVAVPSRFESYGYVVREALAENRPVLGADAGGIADALETGGAGWSFPAGDEAALTRALAERAADLAGVRALIADGAPRRALEPELDPARFPRAYGELQPRRPARAAAGASGEERGAGAPDGAVAPDAARVVAVIATERGGQDLERTIASLEASGDVELVVAATGPELVPARLLGRLHAVVVAEGDTGALHAAGLARARSHGPALLIRAGDTVRPAFLERARAALQADPALAYVTAHAPGWRPACAPLGNFGARLVPELHVAGTAVLAQHGDAAAPASRGGGAGAPLLALAERGRYGAVLSERLLELSRPPAPELNGRATAPSA
jgi:glycogen(starch) synthase